jgi:hypothetical protein
VSAQNSDEIAAIQGRLWSKRRGADPREKDPSAPVANGSVLVTDTDLTKLFGEATTLAGTGPDTGFFQITKLPANQDLLVFYYDGDVPGHMQVEETRLTPNENKELNPNDPNAPVTRLMTATDLLDALKRLVNQHLELALQAHDTKTAESLKAHLDKLNLPAEQDEFFETETMGGGGLSGKTIGVLGAAAGGAGLALAAASGGSDETNSTPPTTTVTTTTTTVPPGSWNCELLAISADRRWMNTWRGVTEGSRVKLRAWGTVTIDADGGTATPDGSGQGMADSSAVMPGAPLHSLICAWDANGSTKFFVGTEVTVDVTVTGVVYCTVNEQPDRDSSYMDNSGAWTFEFCLMMPWSGVQ